MYFVSLYMDGTKWFCRTEILTCAASNATAQVDGRELWRVLILRIGWNHHDGSRWTVASTVAAFHTIGEDDAVFLRPYRMTNLDARLILLLDRLDGTSRTNLTASVTLRSAVSTLIRHRRLHQLHQVGRWTEHIVRALRYTELAGSTVLRHVLGRE